jgi:hypothetical protein
MPKLSLPVSRLIRENLSILMTFAFSRAPLYDLITNSFVGEWKNLQETVFSMAEQRAEKACLELAIFLRYLDDEEGLSKYVDGRMNFQFGRLHLREGIEQELKLRDVANKIIHAAGFEWDTSNPQRPSPTATPEMSFS